MSRTYLLAIFGSLALAGGVALWRGMPQDAPQDTPASFALFTEEEIASAPPLSDEELAKIASSAPQKMRSLTLTQSRGPVIKVSAPSGFALNSPVDFDIRIEPRDGIAVDMKTLRIEYKMGPLWMNLTQRIMRQATITGSRFIARGAQLPPGNHALRLTVQDEKSRKTQALVTFSVRK